MVTILLVSFAMLLFPPPTPPPRNIYQSSAKRSLKTCISVAECDAKCCKCQSICEDVTSSRSVAAWH